MPRKQQDFFRLFNFRYKQNSIELDRQINDSDKVIFIAWGLIEDFKFINIKTGLFSKFAKLDKENEY
jgi:hypothetical protein